MGRLSDIRRKFEKLKGNEARLAISAFREKEDVAKNMVASQLAQGIKSDGTLADFTYSPLTIAIKRHRTGLASITAYLTNYDTGESYKKLTVKFTDVNVQFGTASDKEAAISERMDGEAFRLTKDNKTELVRQHAKPNFLKKIHQFLKDA